MNSFRRLSFLAVILFLVLAAVSSRAQQIARITSAVDEAQRVALPQTAARVPRGAIDQGRAAPDTALERMLLVLAPSAEQKAALSQFLDAQQDAGSGEFHQWLTPEEFGRRFGSAPADQQQVAAWLEGHGMKVGHVAAGGQWIEFSGSAAQVEQAFQAEFHSFMLSGQTHTANVRDLAIPAALAPVVAGIAKLNDFGRKPQILFEKSVTRAADGSWQVAGPDATNGGNHFLAPADFAAIYNLNPLYTAKITGAGESIAIAGRTDIAMSDIQAFRQAFQLPLTYPNVIVNGIDPGYTGDIVEAALDIEWSGATAPGAQIVYVASSSTAVSDGIDLSAAYIVEHNLAPVMSVSYGDCESDLGATENAFWSALYQQAAAEGISAFVSSGDSGAAGCDDPNNNKSATGGLAINGLASTPFNTAVGGTMFDDTASPSTYWSSTNQGTMQSALGYIPEKVWNESCSPGQAGTTCTSYSLWSGGGGVSSVYSKPAWQTGTGVPADSHRDVPDVSLTSSGHDGYLVCYYGTCQFTGGSGTSTVLQNASVVGGTSAASPAMAGIMALVDQKLGARQGLANYLLYKIAAGEQLTSCNSSSLTNPSSSSACSFYDISSGNNSVPGVTGYSAATGYDLASGLGSVNAANLANAWSTASFTASSTTLNLASTTLAHGQPVNVSGAVTGSGGTPTGSVELLTDKYGPVTAEALSSGAYSGSVTTLPGGSYNLTATYPGDATYGGSVSSPVAVTVSPESSTVTLGAYNYINGPPQPLSTAPYGYYIYFSAQVNASSGQGIPTGTVSFYDGASVDTGTLLGTAAVTARGEAMLVSAGPAPVCLGIGQHSVFAVFSGDNSFTSSTSAAVPISITKGTAYPVINETTINVAAGQTATDTVYVSGSGTTKPTGTVQFYDMGVALGSAVTISQSNTATNPQVIFQAVLATGTHTITAIYSGDSNYNPAPGIDTLAVTVTSSTGTPVTVTLTPTLSTSTVGSYTQYNVTVQSTKSGGAAVTGTVQLYESGTVPVGLSASIVNGAATLSAQWAFAGSQVMTVQYSGDANYAAGGAAAAPVLVARATPIIQLSSSPQSSATVQPIALSAVVSSGFSPGSGQVLVNPGGQVQFYDSLNGGSVQPLGAPVNIMLGNGSTMVATTAPTLGFGLHTITATYLASPEYNSVTSSAISVQVGTPGVTVSGPSSAVAVSAGASANATITLTPVFGFSGTVNLACSGTMPPGVSCAFNPATPTLTAAPVTSTLTISTTAPSSSNSATLDWPRWLAPGSAALACLLLIFLPRSKARLLRIGSLLLSIVLAGLASCGGGGGGSTYTPPSNLASTTTAISTASTKVASGTSLTLTAAVTGSASSITGSVTFLDSGASIGTGTLSSGKATLALSTLSVGTHSLSASYSGDSANSASFSGTLHQAITGTTQVQVTATAGTVLQSVSVPITIQ